MCYEAEERKKSYFIAEQGSHAFAYLSIFVNSPDWTQKYEQKFGKQRHLCEIFQL